MNKVISINLNGNAYQLEEGGFEALRSYLDTAGRRLEGNPDKAEIMADIEQAIADKFRSLLGVNKTVVVTKEVETIIAEMGAVEDASGSPETPPPGSAAQPAGAAQGTESAAAPKRLFKIHEGAMVGGVCNGIAAYLNVDVTLVRIVFALLMFAYGSGVLVYLLLMFILPSATTPAEMAAAHGSTSATAQEFIRRAREGYYEGMKTFGDKRAYREWKRKFKREMRSWKWDFHHDMQQGAHRWWPGWGSYVPPRHPPGSMFAATMVSILLLMFILPSATTPAEMAAAHGSTSATAQEFIRRAREGYYEGMKTFGDKRAYREWKRKFKREMRSWKWDFHHDMQQHAHRWWSGWGPSVPPRHPPGSMLAATIVSVLLLIATFAGLLAVVSLVSSGTVFGLMFFPSLPFWLRIVLLIAIISIVRGPLKHARRSLYYGYGYHDSGCWSLWCIVKWVLIVYFIIWLCGGHTGLGEAVQHLPPKLHHAADSVQQWWNQQ